VESIDWGRIGHSGRLNHFIQVIIYVVWILSTVFSSFFRLKWKCVSFVCVTLVLFVGHGRVSGQPVFVFVWLFCFICKGENEIEPSPEYDQMPSSVAQGMWERVCASSFHPEFRKCEWMKLEDEGAESGNGCRISSTFPVSRNSGIENSRRRRLAVQQILFCSGRQCLVLDLFVDLIFHLLCVLLFTG
jgi:hypothetical protein